MILLQLYRHSLEMDNSIVKQNIIARRKELKLTQAEMAERLGMSRNAYRSIERGETRLINENIDRIASILDNTAEELVLGYIPLQTGEKILEEMKEEQYSRSRNRELEYEDHINLLKLQVSSLESRIALLEDLVRTKDEIITMLKKREER